MIHVHDSSDLVEADLTPIDALRAATVLPAQKFQCISDRGVIAPGKKADLVLVDGDPTKDITKTREIRYVWCNGVVTPFRGEKRYSGGEGEKVASDKISLSSCCSGRGMSEPDM